MVKLSDVVPPTAIAAAPNALAIVGAAIAFTWRVPDAGPPGPASLLVTCEVVIGLPQARWRYLRKFRSPG
jgi:hypothetical protein